MSYYYDDKDIAATLKRAIAQGASYDEVDRLLNARNRKIDAGGAALAQYKNDDLTREAEAYLASRREHPGVDLEKFQAAREQAAADNLRSAGQSHFRNYSMGVKAAETDAQQREKELYNAYRRDAIGKEELLANGGLGRGAAAPSSGYGESARTATYLGYQNALAQVREQESRQKADLFAQYMDAMDESQRTYGDKRDAIAKDYADKHIDQLNADREYLLRESEHDVSVNQFNQTFDASRKDAADARTAAEAARADDAAQAKFDNAMQTFKETGRVTTQAEADILGLPVGTKTMARDAFEDDSTHMWSTYVRDLEWHAEEMAYKNRALNVKSSSGGGGSSKVSNQVFENNYELFKAVGEVVTEEMSEVLGLPVGTQYWQYVESVAEGDRKQQEIDFETARYDPYEH